ncbi:hypothetical protein BK656_05305 [Pseudomonas brassicacearum]|nr:hypothetical protein BK656_05305 [Pseudomonas brassicacearum]
MAVILNDCDIVFAWLNTVNLAVFFIHATVCEVITSFVAKHICRCSTVLAIGTISIYVRISSEKDPKILVFPNLALWLVFPLRNRRDQSHIRVLLMGFWKSQHS